MERDPADQLDVIMALAEGSDRGFANRRENLRNQAVELLAVGQALAEKVG